MAVYEVSRTYKSIRVIEAESRQDALEIADELWGMDDEYTFEETSMRAKLVTRIVGDVHRAKIQAKRDQYWVT